VNIHLGQVLLTAVVTAVVGLLMTESYQTTPWLADKLMRWSVRLRYTDNPERATIREEELISILGDLPTLFKLPTAGGFFLRALAYRLANRRNHGSHSRPTGDVLLLPTLYLINCAAYSSWSQLGEVGTKPWLLLVWLYAVVMLIPLAWRSRAPVAVFATQWVLTVAAWPITPIFTPIIGIPVALYAVAARCSKKISLLALLASFIPNGLAAAVAFRTWYDFSQQISAFTSSAIFLILVAVGAWGAGRLTQASELHVQHQTEPRRAGQLSLEARFQVKRDVLLLAAFYLCNCFTFSAWIHLGEVATKPWLLLVWLYGLVILIPLAWRDKAPMTIFAIQWVLTVAAWPIMPLFTPVTGIPVALYAVAFHHGRKISLLTLLASIIPVGLCAAVAFRVFPTYGEQLLPFISNVIFLVLITAGAWRAGRMMRVGQQHVQHQTEPRTGQLSPEASVL
jgi:hypothetical protein